MPAVQLRWNNGYLIVGPMMERDAIGLILAWGRRDLLEVREIPEGEYLFDRYVKRVFVTGRQIRQAGGFWKALLLRLVQI